MVERKGLEQGGAKPIILNWAEKSHLVPLHLNLPNTWFRPETLGHRPPLGLGAHSQANEPLGKHLECVWLKTEMNPGLGRQLGFARGHFLSSLLRVASSYRCVHGGTHTHAHTHTYTQKIEGKDPEVSTK